MKYVPLFLLLCAMAGIVLLARNLVVARGGWDLTPSYIQQNVQQRIQREQLLRDRDYMLLVNGEASWRAGNLKMAEANFKAVINDTSFFPGKTHFNTIARANLVKLYRQQGRTAEAKS